MRTQQAAEEKKRQRQAKLDAAKGGSEDAEAPAKASAGGKRARTASAGA